MADMLTLIKSDCEASLGDNDFIEKLRALKLDMALVTRFFPMYCIYLVPHYLRIPYASISGFYEPLLGGSPNLPSFTPFIFFSYTDRMNFFQRTVNTLVTAVFAVALHWDLPTRGQADLRLKYAPDVSSFKELVDRSQLFFVTHDHVLERPIPTFPNVIRVPSLNSHPAQPLPADLEQIVSASKDGVIVVSFGSLASYLPTSCANKMIDAFGKVKQTVIWRANLDKSVAVPANVHVLKWLPQNDLLGHKNTRLFITHCGNNGQHESVFHGKPMIGFPLQPEQHHNAVRMAARGYGIYLDLSTFTSDSLLQAIRALLDNETYTQNVVKASAIQRDSAMTPRQTVAYWMEHVIKHGHEHLRSHAMDLAWYEYFMIDVFAFLSAVLAIVLVTSLALCRCCYRCVKRRCSGQQQQQRRQQADKNKKTK
jgi:UDP:flavonoid glycosyltransferase YjiC (YdhE family)